MTSSSSSTVPGAGGHPNTVPLIAAGVMFMEHLDATVIVTALPAMATAFGSTATSVSLGVSGYMLAVAVFIPLSAWLADRFGTRTVLCSAIALFTLASVICGLSTSLSGFVATRVLQGAAAALMSPVARLVVVRNTSKADLLQAVAIITWPALIAPVLGPPIGGFITTYASWRWIFFMNLPIGLLGLALAWRFVPQQTSPERRRFDVAGFALMAGALAGLILGLELLGGAASGWGLGALCALLGLGLGVLAVRHVAQRSHPIFSLAAMRVQSFAITVGSGGFLTRATISATPFLLPLMFQFAFGLSAFAAGLMILAYFAGNIGMKLVTSRIIRRFGFRQVLIGNGVAVVLSAVACAALGPGWPTAAILAALLVGGCARSLQMTALNSLAFADVPAEHTSAASTLSSLMQQMAMTLGVALGAFLLNLSLMLRGGSSLALQDFQLAFVCIAAMACVALVLYARLPAAVGAVVSGHQVPLAAKGSGQR